MFFHENSLPNTQYVSLMLDNTLCTKHLCVGLLRLKTALFSDDFSILNPPYVVKPPMVGIAIKILGIMH